MVGDEEIFYLNFTSYTRFVYDDFFFDWKPCIKVSYFSSYCFKINIYRNKFTNLYYLNWLLTLATRISVEHFQCLLFLNDCIKHSILIKITYFIICFHV